MITKLKSVILEQRMGNERSFMQLCGVVGGSNKVMMGGSSHGESVLDHLHPVMSLMTGHTD